MRNQLYCISGQNIAPMNIWHHRCSRTYRLSNCIHVTQELSVEDAMVYALEPDRRTTCEYVLLEKTI